VSRASLELAKEILEPSLVVLSKEIKSESSSTIQGNKKVARAHCHTPRLNKDDTNVGRKKARSLPLFVR
jgi:hypothetical protein